MSRAITGAMYNRYLGILKNPNAQRWLHTIRYAEGTNKYPDPYGTAFTGASFDTSGPHPDTVYRSKSGYASAAHGAYQAMPATWNEAWGKNQVMSPQNQDVFAIHKLVQRGVDPTQPFSRDGSNTIAPEWASFPKHNGLSFHGQPVKSFSELESEFNNFQPPEPTPPPAPEPANVQPSDLQIHTEGFWGTM